VDSIGDILSTPTTQHREGEGEGRGRGGLDILYRLLQSVDCFSGQKTRILKTLEAIIIHSSQMMDQFLGLSIDIESRVEYQYSPHSSPSSRSFEVLFIFIENKNQLHYLFLLINIK
jgi:hypothetical protein